jgi:hypothetical protein
MSNQVLIGEHWHIDSSPQAGHDFLELVYTNMVQLRVVLTE